MRVFPAGAVLLVAAFACGGEDAETLPPPVPEEAYHLGGGVACQPYPDGCDPGQQCVRKAAGWRCSSPPGVRTRNTSCVIDGEAADRCEPNHLCVGPAAEARCLRLCTVASNCPTDAPRCVDGGDGVKVCLP